MESRCSGLPRQQEAKPTLRKRLQHATECKLFEDSSGGGDEYGGG